MQVSYTIAKTTHMEHKVNSILQTMAWAGVVSHEAASTREADLATIESYYAQTLGLPRRARLQAVWQWAQQMPPWGQKMLMALAEMKKPLVYLERPSEDQVRSVNGMIAKSNGLEQEAYMMFFAGNYDDAFDNLRRDREVMNEMRDFRDEIMGESQDRAESRISGLYPNLGNLVNYTVFLGAAHSPENHLSGNCEVKVVGNDPGYRIWQQEIFTGSMADFSENAARHLLEKAVMSCLKPSDTWRRDRRFNNMVADMGVEELTQLIARYRSLGSPGRASMGVINWPEIERVSYEFFHEAGLFLSSNRVGEFIGNLNYRREGGILPKSAAKALNYIL
ncbi:MAG: hypothetical protein ABH879_06895 [archaeon]